MVRNTVRILTVLCALCLFAGITYAQAGGESGKKATKSSETTAKTGKKAKQVDINSASKEDLAALPVIGDATAQKIIDGRPYKTKRDLVTKQILTQDQYDKVKDQLVAHKPKGEEKGGKKSKKESPDTGKGGATPPPK